MNYRGNLRSARLVSVLALAAIISVGWASRSRAKDEPVEAPSKDPAKEPAVEAPDFGGKYLADGVGNGGRAYRAMVEIRREGETYEVVWVLSPRETYSGVGLVTGDSLCVGWAAGGTPGVIVYTPHRDEKGKLVGRWTAPGAEGKTFKETLTPVK